MNTVSFGDYGAEQADIERRRKYAEALQAQSMQPLETQTAGGWAIPISPTQGLAKALQAYMGKQGIDKAKADQLALGQRFRQEGQADVTNFMGALQGTPSQPEKWTGEAGDELYTPEKPVVAGDKQKALAIALNSQNPMVTAAGQSILAQMLKSPEWKLGERFNKDTGKQEKFMYDSNNPTNMMPVGGQQGVSADTEARLKQAKDQWMGLSGYQQQQLAMDAAKLGISVQELMISRANAANRGIETQFNTGHGVVPAMPNAPQIPQVPQAGASVPPQPMQQPVMQPPARPAGAPAMQQPVQPSAQQPLVPPAMQNRITPKKQAELAAERPEAVRTYNEAATALDALNREIDYLLGNEKGPGARIKPNLDAAVGTIAGFTPSVRQDVVNADKSIETIKAQLGVQALNAMRQASKTGGAVGQVTEKEWPILQSQIANLNNRGDPATFRQNLQFVKSTIDRWKGNARTQLESTYGVGSSGDKGGSPRSFANEAEAVSAGVKPGEKVIINGVSGTWH